MQFFTELPLYSAALCALYAAGELCVKEPTERNRLLTALFAGFALVLFHAGMTLSGRIFQYPHLFQVQLPVVFCIGPLFLHFFRRVLEPERRRTGLALHFVPALIVLLLMIPFYLQDAATKSKDIAHFLNGARDGMRLSALLFAAGLIHFAVYVALSAGPLLPLLNAKHLREEPVVRVALIILAACFGISGFAIAALLTRTPEILRFSVANMALLAPVLYLLRRRHPTFFQNLEFAVQEEKYRRSQLGGVDLNDVRIRLETLMHEERIYTEESLTLQGLAERLNLTPHQLSEFFNAHLGQSFPAYVNGRRIERACELLKAEPDRTVLSIAYEVGFNSKTTFNTAFTKATGMSPSKFRKARRSGL